MSPEERERLRTLADAATPGPWTREAGWIRSPDGYQRAVVYCTDDVRPSYEADGDFIAAARTAVPDLLDDLDAAESALDEAQRGGKYYVKARVYGAIAAEYGRALRVLAERGDATAKAALEWRHSERGGVPMAAVMAIGELLDAASEAGRRRSPRAREGAGGDRGVARSLAE